MKHKHLLRPLSLALGALLFSSCATQQDYTEAVDLAEHYQEQLLELQVQEARLRSDNEKLRQELAMAQVNALEASSGTSDDLERRLSEYERRLAELRQAPDEITRLNLEDGSYIYMVPDAVLFQSGSADIGAEGKRALIDQVAADINSASHGRIWIRGHTDSVPVAKPATLKKFPHGNLQLSSARALEVWAVLTKQGGVPESEIVVAGFGPYAPLVTNDTEENRALNRRVEILVSPAN